MNQLTGPTVSTTQTPKLYSAPVHLTDKEFLLNEAIRTGLSQKDIIGRALAALRKHQPIPGALPIKLS